MNLCKCDLWGRRPFQEITHLGRTHDINANIHYSKDIYGIFMNSPRWILSQHFFIIHVGKWCQGVRRCPGRAMFDYTSMFLMLELEYLEKTPFCLLVGLQPEKLHSVALKPHSQLKCIFFMFQYSSLSILNLQKE